MFHLRISMGRMHYINISIRLYMFILYELNTYMFLDIILSSKPPIISIDFPKTRRNKVVKKYLPKLGNLCEENIFLLSLDYNTF